MKNFIKNFSLYNLVLSCALIISTANMQASGSADGDGVATGTGIPSVAEVFGGLSEQEIADQVQMGQQFLEDLRANGSPEDIEAFMNMLANTVNSMSDEDWKDIEAISEMVKPLIPMPEEPTITPDNKSETKPKDVVKPESNATEAFKQLISSITQRIDDIVQKINSSKECAEEMDAKWKNKSTFNNMKRQIYQLRTDRLAEKLGKKDVSGDEKDLVETLKKYLTDLTEHNEKLVIEDNFGLPSSLAVEKKQVKQTIAYLDMSDEYIDKLMPKLEKFLRKYDPEALQMAKEAEEQSKKAIKSATDATVRRPSADARPLQATPSGPKPYSPTSPGYSNYDGGGYYDDYGQGYPGSSSYPEDIKGGSKSKSESSPSKAKEIAPTAKAADITKNKDNRYQDILGDLEGHLKDDYPTSHENQFVQFLQQDLITNYPIYKQAIINGLKESTEQVQTGTQGNTYDAQEDAWVNSTGAFINGGFANYTADVVDRLKKDFTKEFTPLHNILGDMEENMHKMSADDLKKLQSAKELTTLESRLKHYQNTFESVLPAIDKKYQRNALSPSAPQVTEPGNPIITLQGSEAIVRYNNAHKDFIKTLTTEVGDKIEALLSDINRVKRKAKRNASKKQTDSEKSTT